MSDLWLPGLPRPQVNQGKASTSQVSGRGALALLTPDERKLFDASVVKAVAYSFAVDKIRANGKQIVMTRSEVKWRTDACIEAFAVMAMDWHWGVKKSCRQLAMHLRKKIDQITIHAPSNQQKKGSLLKVAELSDLITPE